jgi:hypothetical protein
MPANVGAALAHAMQEIEFDEDMAMEAVYIEASKSP